ncbi:MAG: radical SAM protein [Nanoarchaeota archaeon]|nr:radical SAM protein [Nanoarchaeota archaeon]
MTVKRFLKDSKNLIQLYRSYEKKELDIKHFPPLVLIEVAGKCNLSCIMCPNSLYKEKAEAKGIMDFELFKKIVDNIHTYTSVVFLHLGGEVLLNPKLVDMVRYLKKNGLSVVFYTNAIMLTEKKSKELILAGVDMISFSIDGYTKEEYERIRVGGKFDMAIKGINTFLKAKKELKKKNPHTIIQVIEFGKENPDDKQRFFDLFRDNPPNDISVIYPIAWGNEFKGTDRFEFKDKEQKEYNPCAWPWTMAGILWNGDVIPCSVDFFGEYVYGNMKDQTFEEIWFGEKPRILREAMVNKTYAQVKNQCNGCDTLTVGKQFGLVAGVRRVFLSQLSHHFGFGFDKKVRNILDKVYTNAKFKQQNPYKKK